MTTRADIKPYSMADFNQLISKVEDPHQFFFRELEELLRHEWRGGLLNWNKKEGVPGDMWELLIGKRSANGVEHIYTSLFVTSNGLVVPEHGHTIKTEEGNIYKTEEWYIFPDGKIEHCGEDETHMLVNDFGRPIYVISVKRTRRLTAVA